MGPRDHDRKISDLQVIPSWLATCPVRQLLAEIIRSCRKLSCQRLLSSRPFSGADGSPYDPALSSLETSYTDFLTYLVFQKCSIPDMGYLWGKDYKNVIKSPDMSKNSSFLTPHLWGKKITLKKIRKNFQNPPHLFHSKSTFLREIPPFPMDSIPFIEKVLQWSSLDDTIFHQLPGLKQNRHKKPIFTTQKKNWLGKLNKILSNRWF